MYPKARKFYLFLICASLFTCSVYLYNTSLARPISGLHSTFPTPPWKTKPKYAYATFLGPPTSKEALEHQNSTDYTSILLKDPYFISVRLLTYQIMHAEKTRTKFDGVPFLVLVLPQVPKSQTDVLKKEGATIVEVQPLDLPDLFDKNYIMGSRFRDVLSKLRLWQLTDYERVLYLDADSFLLERLDGLFLDERYSVPVKTLPSNATRKTGGESKDDVEGNSHGRKVFEPPEEFIMAASTDTYGDQTEWEQPGHVNYLCACFMLFAPSEQMFDYYRYVLTGPDAPPNAAYPEQDLLIYVHRLEGQMPWTRIPIEWSANDGEMVDELVGGVKSLHVKGWEGAEGGNVANEKTKAMWRSLVKEMEDYWKAAERWTNLKS